MSQPGISKSAILEIVAAQKSRFTVRDLLAVAYQQEPNEKAALFRVIGEIADANAVPELIGRLHGKDAIARVHIINILSRFNMPEVQTALLAQLKDPHKLIRGASLGALQKWTTSLMSSGCAPCCAILRSMCRTRPWMWSSRPTTPIPFAT